ncbi:MAG: hypothetical protein RL518_1155 [Pseudomonadota bacterium]|jgi:hypothetical protein
MTSKHPPIQLAEKLVASYSFDETTGFSTFTIPAGITDVEAMKSLNAFFREKLPTFSRDVVEGGDAEWKLSVSYEEPPKKFPDDFRKRDYSKPREVIIMVVVPGTEGKTRELQGEVLAQRGLVFADPRDIAVAVALHACKHAGASLCRHFAVRGSWHDMVQCNGRDGLVFETAYDDDEEDNHDVAASGTP